MYLSDARASSEDIRFTVVIPAYNAAKTIDRALACALDQTYPPDEVIIVDDASTDDTCSIVSCCVDARVRLIASSENRGPGASRNRGVEAARSPYIALLDADDMWLPMHLETMRTVVEAHPEAVLYGTGYAFVRSSGARRDARIVGLHGPDEQSDRTGILSDYYKSAVLGDPPVPSITASFRRDTFLRLGGFRTDVRLGEDTDLWMRFADSGPVARAARVTAEYHIDPFAGLSLTSTHLSEADFDCPHLVEWPRQREGATFWKREFIAKRQLERLNGLYRAGYGRRVRRELANVRTDVRRAELQRLRLLTYLVPVEVFRAIRRAGWWARRSVVLGNAG